MENLDILGYQAGMLRYSYVLILFKIRNRPSAYRLASNLLLLVRMM